jgi:hypothetical protein
LQQTDHQLKLKEEKAKDPTIVEVPKRDYKDIWEAAELGDVAGGKPQLNPIRKSSYIKFDSVVDVLSAVKLHVEKENFDVRKHNDVDMNRPGSTLLHYACW